MSAASSASSKSKGQPASDTGPFRTPIPMKPRPALFRALLGVFIAWCGVMVWMYIKAIHPSATTSPTQQPPATMPAVAQQAP